MGFENPSEIQHEAIPELLEQDRDFLGLAQTGTGKTAAFGLPLIERMDSQMPLTQALILAPTRELGQQIAKQLALFGKYQQRVNMLAVYGGAPIVKQLKALRSETQHIIIATPGRLIDLLKRGAVDLRGLRYLVLDEADEMLNMGFKEDLDEILEYTAEGKNLWLFSATMSKDIKGIVKRYMTNPLEVQLNSKQEVNENIEHQYVGLHYKDKPEALGRFLDAQPDMRAVVFCRTRRNTQELAELLIQRGYTADALHGDLSQAQRDQVMRRFRQHNLQMLIATDIAARGIDVDDLTHVFHYHLPDDLSYYTHRSGRTARAGKKGLSIAFVEKRDFHRLRHIEKMLGLKIKQADVPSAELIRNERLKNWCKNVSDQSIRANLTEEMKEQANLLFANLSKEELIDKVLVHELSKIQLGKMGTPQSFSEKGGGDRGRSGRKDGRHGGYKGKKRSGSGGAGKGRPNDRFSSFKKKKKKRGKY